MESAAEWDRRLGWTFDLIADDSTLRQSALRRLAATQERRDRALRDLNEVWRGKGLSAAREEQARYAEARRNTYPDALWEFVPADVRSGRGGLRYAILYLTWEARFPAEWTAAAKSWSTKRTLLWKLADAVPDLPAGALGELVELVELVRHAVRRDHRCEDAGYALLARAMGGALLRPVLTGIAGDFDETSRLRARYLLWLLDHPEPPLPKPKAAQWKSWLFGE